MQNPSLLPPTVRPTRRASVREFKVRDELILFASQEDGADTASRPGERAITLNTSGRSIWELCDGQHTLGDIVETLKQHYDGPEAGLRADIMAALFRLQTLDMLDLERDEVATRPPVRFVVGVEDKTSFYWQLPILFESLQGQLPPDWDMCVVVCNDHEPLSEPLLHIFNNYNVRFLTGRQQSVDQTGERPSGTDKDLALRQIEALTVLANRLRDDDVVCLLDTDAFLYKDLNLEIFPHRNALCGKRMSNQNPPTTTGAQDDKSIDLSKLLEALGCTTPFEPGGLPCFLTGSTVKNEKFLDDCLRFTQILPLAGEIIEAPMVRTAEMPSIALALAANGIACDIIDPQEFSVNNCYAESIAPGTLYYYFSDPIEGEDGGFWKSRWHKRQFRDTDLLKSDVDRFSREAVSDHERYFFELAKRARQRLYADDASGAGGVER